MTKICVENKSQNTLCNGTLIKSTKYLVYFDIDF